MHKIQIFENAQFGQIRTVMSESNEPMFCLSDVCNVIGIKDVSRCASRLDEDVRLTHPLETKGGMQRVTFVTESGLYDVIIRSDSPKAKPFRKWVTSEVLPSIRKHGAYMTAQSLYIPRTYSDALRFAATQIEEKEALQHQIAMNAPKLAIAEAFESSTGVCSVAELAHILTQNGHDTGERKLFTWLRDNGYLCKRRDVWNQPTQYSIEKGLFEIKRTLIEHSNGTSEVRNTPKVTIKGQAYFIKLLTGNNQPTKSLTAC